MNGVWQAAPVLGVDRADDLRAGLGLEGDGRRGVGDGRPARRPASATARPCRRGTSGCRWRCGPWCGPRRCGRRRPGAGRGTRPRSPATGRCRDGTRRWRRCPSKANTGTASLVGALGPVGDADLARRGRGRGSEDEQGEGSRGAQRSGSSTGLLCPQGQRQPLGRSQAGLEQHGHLLAALGRLAAGLVQRHAHDLRGARLDGELRAVARCRSARCPCRRRRGPSGRRAAASPCRP